MGNAKGFTAFIHQLQARNKDRTLVLVADNSSVHKAKRVMKFMEDHPRVKLFFLPAYSPEYNPTEQVWKWLKPLVHAAKTIANGAEELLGRIRKTAWAWTHGRLASPPKIGLGIWGFIC